MQDVIVVCPIADVQDSGCVHHAADTAGAHIEDGSHCPAIGGDGNCGFECIRGCIERIISHRAGLGVDQHVDDRAAIVDCIHGNDVVGFGKGNRRGKVAGGVGETRVVRPVDS